jgi:hypothetical protein
MLSRVSKNNTLTGIPFDKGFQIAPQGRWRPGKALATRRKRPVEINKITKKK